MRTSLAVSVLLCWTAILACAECNFIVDARPGTLLVSQSAGDFEALGPGPERLGVTELEEAAEFTTLPNLRAGAGWSTDAAHWDLTGQVGYLLNERFRSLVAGLDAAVMLRVRRNIAAGPHLGYIRILDPEWTGDADLDLDPAGALVFGVQAVIGYDILFVFAADYISAEPMDVTTHGDWRSSDDELDISGLSLQFGVMGRF